MVLHSGATVVPVPQSWTVARTREEGAAARLTSLSGPDVHAGRGLSQRAKNDPYSLEREKERRSTHVIFGSVSAPPDTLPNPLAARFLFLEFHLLSIEIFRAELC